MKNILKFFDTRNLSLRNKLLLSILPITGLAVIIFGYFFFARTQQAQAILSNELQTAVQQQSEQQLENIVLSEAKSADQILLDVATAMQNLANYQTALYTQTPVLSTAGYWDANTNLIKLSGGQYGNSVADISSIFIPNDVTLNDAFITDLNLNIYLDFSAPAILASNPNIGSVYFISESNYTIYYPNIDLANFVPPDFDARDQSFYTIVAPQNNPERGNKWTIPYQDPAGAGLIVTNSTPVYNQQDRFMGVLGADIPLATIAEHILTIKVGESGFAFLIDSEGHIISMPQVGYTLFGLLPEEIPVNETPKNTVLEVGSQELRDNFQKMILGEQDLKIITVNNNQYYMAYAPLQTTDYSLALLVPVVELNQLYLETQNTIESETRATVTTAFIIILLVLLGAATISFFLSQTLSRPLVELTKIAEQIAQGNLNVKAPVESDDEIGNLAKTFNTMSEQLQEAFASFEKRVADRTKALETSSEVSRYLSTIIDRTTLAKEVVEKVQSAFNYYHAHIYFFDEQKENLVMASGTGEAGAAMLASEHKIERGRGLVGRAAESNEPILVPDVSQAIGWLPNPLLPDTKAEAAVPIAIGNEVLGVLDVQHNIVNGLGSEDITLLQSLAGQIAVSLQNARAYERSAAQAELESLANVIGQKIQKTASIEETLQTAVRELGLAVGASRVKVKIGLQQEAQADEGSEN